MPEKTIDVEANAGRSHTESREPGTTEPTHGGHAEKLQALIDDACTRYDKVLARLGR